MQLFRCRLCHFRKHTCFTKASALARIIVSLESGMNRIWLSTVLGWQVVVKESLARRKVHSWQHVQLHHTMQVDMCRTSFMRVAEYLELSSAGR
jgi:hypothetical protein